jgi:hypothetical protein
VVNLGSRSIRVLETIGRDASGRRLIWSWFEIGGRTAHSRFGAVAVDLLARVDGRLDAAFFAVSASCSDTCDGARESIQKFVVAAHPYLSPAFAASADSSSRGAL